MSGGEGAEGPARRILSLWLPALALDRWRLDAPEAGRGLDAGPLVLIADTAHGPRIEAVNGHAAREGVRAGMMLADARTLCPQLATAGFDPAGDGALLQALAIWAQRWGPWSAMDAPDGLLVDVTAVAHLFGGEEALLQDVHARFRARGLAIRSAIAPTAGAAWALAHYGPDRAIVERDIGRALSGLPVAALRLEPATLTVLRRLGLKRIGQVAEIGRDALQRRFRTRKSLAANPLIRLDQLLGHKPEPMLPVIARIAPLAQRRLMEPIRHRELLDQVVGDLAADMARLLESKGLGARRLELALWRVDAEVAVRHLEMAAPSRDPAHICRLFAARLDDVDAGFGIEMLRLRAVWTEPLALEQGDIEAGADRPGTSLATCIDRLSARLGARAISRPVPFASHIPERAQRWHPPLEPEPSSQGLLEFHARPLKMLDKPEHIAVLYATPDGYPQRFRWRGGVHEVVRVEGPERIAPEWWRERGSARLRDYYRIEDGEGRRYWIYRQGILGDGRGGAPDWFLQGLCA
ncbi:DNA polymerase Y family protein [Qipengyuania sp. 6B39]|uniref:Y-family DNA polymerase n=1 Tax=Qipengyuania proteolytica TaxID=2867239 RepID=UPI001C890A5E|nr:DUF6504 family protein [Qipengyuania proteolytica]MBX7495942.1 DNA polymerase Y family protein [Qipengyuania proteolytica]